MSGVLPLPMIEPANLAAGQVLPSLVSHAVGLGWPWPFSGQTPSPSGSATSPRWRRAPPQRAGRACQCRIASR